MRFDGSGVRYLDVNPTSFWKSFFAAVICFPGAYFLSTLHETETTSSLEPFATLLIDTLFYVISWLVYPVFMHALLVLHNKQENYRIFIIGYNWLQVWQMAFLICLQLLIGSGVFPTSATGFIGFFGMLYILASQGYMTKTTLKTNWLSASAFVLFNIILAMSIYELNERVLAS